MRSRSARSSLAGERSGFVDLVVIPALTSLALTIWSPRARLGPGASGPRAGPAASGPQAPFAWLTQKRRDRDRLRDRLGSDETATVYVTDSEATGPRPFTWSTRKRRDRRFLRDRLGSDETATVYVTASGATWPGPRARARRCRSGPRAPAACRLRAARVQRCRDQPWPDDAGPHSGRWRSCSSAPDQRPLLLPWVYVAGDTINWKW